MERRGPDALGHVGAGRDGGGGSPRGLGAVTEQEDLQGCHADVCVCVCVCVHTCMCESGFIELTVELKEAPHFRLFVQVKA